MDYRSGNFSFSIKHLVSKPRRAIDAHLGLDIRLKWDAQYSQHMVDMQTAS